MLHTHGQFALNQVQEESPSYINSTTRKIQNNYQKYVCFKNSVDDYTKRILANKEATYSLSGPPCGITRKAEVDTCVTTSFIR
jgi:hypothetical protein